MTLTAILLAAGEGTRMESDKAKVLHQVAGRPMLLHVLSALSASGLSLSPRGRIVVVGHRADEVEAALQASDESVLTVRQASQLGTGHAVAAARAVAGDADSVLVLYGDVPLIRPETIAKLAARHAESDALVTILTARLEDPSGYGRVVRGEQGGIQRIVEDAHADESERQIREINSGIGVFEADFLWSALDDLEASPSGEYYLTDVVELAAAQDRATGVTAPSAEEALGVNTRGDLARAEAGLRARVRTRLMDQGVTLIDPNTVWIDADVTVARDSVIWPNTFLRGEVTVGPGCQIGPGADIRDSTVGAGAVIHHSVLEGAEIGARCHVGPFSHLRRGTRLAPGVHVGNFGEIKNTTVGEGSRIGHFSYLGDATIGADVNIGAGTVTCNYDGERKHPTVIGGGAFIGSDTMLVAPLTVGPGARTGAGSVVTRDVPAGATVVGVPARPLGDVDADEVP